MAKHKRLWDLYRFPGFYPEHTVFGLFGDPRTRVIRLRRRGKKQSVGSVGQFIIRSTTARPVAFETCLAGI